MTKQPILLDTQLLVLLTVGATEPSLVERHRRTRNAYTRADFELLLDLLGYQPQFQFCEQTAAEASNMVDQHGEPQRTRAMAVLRALLNNATEVPVACRTAMDQPEYAALGLADVAQLALCRQGKTLLTNDEPLFKAATARGVQVLYFADEKLHRANDR